MNKVAFPKQYKALYCCTQVKYTKAVKTIKLVLYKYIQSINNSCKVDIKWTFIIFTKVFYGKNKNVQSLLLEKRRYKQQDESCVNFNFTKQYNTVNFENSVKYKFCIYN